MRRCFTGGFITKWLVAGWIVLSSNGALAEPTRPNVLFILTDDQGWPTLSSFGNQQMATPNLDRLASEGVRMTQAYVMPQCTPTRAALLTGEHTARNGMWHVIGWYGSPWARVSEPRFREQLEPDQCRLPAQLRAAGYRTGMAGKWHLTNNHHGHYTYLQSSSGDAFGFDEVAPPGTGSHNEGDKWVDHLTNAACDFMQANRDRPWFYYLSHHTLHGRVAAPPDLVQAYSERGAPESGHGNATYLAAIDHLDASVGKLLDKLDELEIANNTMVVFLGDNGGVDTKHRLPESAAAMLEGSGTLVIESQEFDNAPLRDGKGSLYEGGIRVPCIVRWPGVIPTAAKCDTPIHVVDWFPTLMSAAGMAWPDETDGVDIAPLWRGDSIPDRDLFWYAPLYDLRWAATPSAVIREGDWKLIEHFGDWFDSQRRYRIGHHIELFNLAVDVGETTDLSQTEPERTQRMQTKLRQWIQSVPASVPALNRHFDRDRAFTKTRQKQPWNQ